MTDSIVMSSIAALRRDVMARLDSVQAAVDAVREDITTKPTRATRADATTTGAASAVHAPTGEDLNFEQRLLAAVWMVGNMDTPEDKAAWWATFRSTWEEVAADGRNAQGYADAMALRHSGRDSS